MLFLLSFDKHLVTLIVERLWPVAPARPDDLPPIVAPHVLEQDPRRPRVAARLLERFDHAVGVVARLPESSRFADVPLLAVDHVLALPELKGVGVLRPDDLVRGPAVDEQLHG